MDGKPKRKQNQSVGTVKASRKTAVTRRKVFIERWLVNGNNATEAAKFAGFSAHTAASQGQRLLKNPEVKALIGTRAEQALTDAQLTTERWAQEMVCLGHFDPGELYDQDGGLIPIHQLPEHVRRAIASVEVVVGKDKETTKKVKFWDKNAALANIGKHLGMFEKDNKQKDRSVKVLVQMMG